jgi:predicted TIM-barrel fold metal-dependent hydrolase
MTIDVHVHPSLATGPRGMEYLLRQAEELDVVLCLSTLTPQESVPFPYKPTLDFVQACNDYTDHLARKHPGRIVPMWYVNPLHGDAACRELEARVRSYQGWQGVKLWIAVHCNDPRLDPLMEMCARYRLPVLQHTWRKITGNVPGESMPLHLRALALRHPGVAFFFGHAGGDHEYGAKCARGLPNAYMDLGGGEAANGYTEALLRHVGADHIVFGSDLPGRSLTSQLAKVYGANLSAEDREKIL